MISQIVFNAASIVFLLVLAYILWSGVGKKRPQLGRGFGALCGAIALFLVWQTVQLLR
ncbi:hypothetical protein [Pontixanthobacter sp.]|uniref:hypothetical protein n=1 Tax=Pontixanthobacter sp. TaxID=2792078 RepID=UPI003C7AFE14